MSALQPGTSVGRYRVIRLIAQGGMAEVYRAEQALTGSISRPVALKVIRPEYSESEDFREMFLDEARTACTLSHPNIAHIYEVGEADGLLYMAMELVPGESLAVVDRLLRANGERLSDEALLAVGIATCSALEAVHARPNLVHRDVSPQNLLLAVGGTLKLIDFGIAKAATNRNLTRVGTTKGKVGYFSPEQAHGKVLDGRSDLFSLGITLYALAAGVGPLDAYSTPIARQTALVRGQWEPLSRVCPDLPRGLLAVVDRATRLKPEERFPHARAMREALEAVALEEGLSVGPGALAGYVHGEGEVAPAAPPGSRRAQAPSGMSAAMSGSRTAVRVPGGRKVWAPVAGVGVGLVLSLTAGALLLPRQDAAPVAPPPASPPVAAVSPPPVKADAPVPAASSVQLSAPEVQPKPAEPPGASGIARPRHESKRLPVHAGAAPVASSVPAPAPAEESLEGEGSLRVGVPPNSGIQAEGLLSGREGREEMPFSVRSLKAGTYTLQVFSSGATVSCTVKVLPNRLTRVVFTGTKCEKASD